MLREDEFAFQLRIFSLELDDAYRNFIKCLETILMYYSFYYLYKRIEADIKCKLRGENTGKTRINESETMIHINVSNDSNPTKISIISFMVIIVCLVMVDTVNLHGTIITALRFGLKRLTFIYFDFSLVFRLRKRKWKSLYAYICT